MGVKPNQSIMHMPSSREDGYMELPYVDDSSKPKVLLMFNKWGSLVSKFASTATGKDYFT